MKAKIAAVALTIASGAAIGYCLVWWIALLQRAP